MRNPIGFIPRDQDDEENDAIDDGQHTLREMWDVRQLAEAHDVLFEQVRRYADQVEALDSDAHNAAQEVSRVVLALSYAETAQERLDILNCEARRLMLAVGEAKRRRRRRENLTMFMPVMLVILYSLLALILEGATPF